MTLEGLGWTVLCQAAVKLTARKEDETERVMAIFPGFQVTEVRVSSLWLHSLMDRRMQDHSPSLKRLRTTTALKCSVFCSGIQNGIPKRNSKVEPSPT